MKKDRDDILSSLRKERFKDLLKLYSSVQERVYTLLNKEGAPVRDIEDAIKVFMEIGNLVDTEITKRVISAQRDRMYEYTRKKK